MSMTLGHWALAAWMVQGAVSTYALWAYGHDLPLREIPNRTPSTVVIIAVKNPSPRFPDFVRRVRGQDYPAYRIVFSVESEDDPAYGLLRDGEADLGAPVEIVIAGLARRGGQKVHNLLAAWKCTTEQDELVAFLDADTSPAVDWLSRLVYRHVDVGHPVVTGYRWTVPNDARAGSALAACADQAIATLPRVGDTALCWGGSTLIPRATLASIEIETWWDGAVSDDLQLSAALRQNKIVPHAARQSLIWSATSLSLAEAVGFGIRQYRLVFFHAVRHWAIAVFLLLIPPVAILLSVPDLARGSIVPWMAFAIAIALASLRIRWRRSLQDRLWPVTPTPCPPQTAGSLMRELCARPVWWVLHAWCVLAAPASRTLRWAGITYQIDGPRDVRILNRSSPGVTSG